MADKILHKRSFTSGSIPTTSSLLIGEIALNVPDGKIYIHKSGSQGNSIESAITSNSTASIGILTLSGSLILSGSTDVNSGSVLDVATDNISFDFDSLAFSGSAQITGSLLVTTGITGSLFGTSSWANNAVTASYVLNAVSSSFATSASFSISASRAVTSSFALTSSFITASNVVGTVTSASFAVTASYLAGAATTVTYIRRSDYTGSHDPNVNLLYLGQAESGSAESANVWDITRLSISSSGATTTNSASGVAWTDRYIVTYL